MTRILASYPPRVPPALALCRVLALLALSAFVALLAGIHACAADFEDSTATLSKDDGSSARRGWFFNQEDEEEWKTRLRANPPGIERAFVQWDPSRDRTEDFAVVLCFNRKVYRPDRLPTVIVKFDDGTELTTTAYDSSFSHMFSGTAEEDRCFDLGERLFHPIGKMASFDSALEQKFRPEHIKKLFITRTTERKYEMPTSDTNQIRDLPFHIAPTRKYHWDKDKPGDTRPVTRDYIRGRMQGEALYYAQRCKGLHTDVIAPSESDQSDQAQGFADGYEFGERFMRRYLTSTMCAFAAKDFDIPQSEISGLIQAP